MTVKAAKRKIRSQMKKYGIKLKDVGARSVHHYQTVKRALEPEERYWNDEIASIANNLIYEKKNPQDNDADRKGTEERGE